jgi:hypothetical protein
MKVSPDALQFCIQFRDEAPESSVFGWLLGVEKRFVLASVSCLHTSVSGVVGIPVDTGKDLAEFEMVLPAGIYVVGFFASHSGATEAELRDHGASIALKRQGLIGCYFAARDVFASRDPTDALVWTTPVSVDSSCRKHFQTSFLPVVLGNEQENVEMSDDLMLVVGSARSNMTWAQIKGKTIAELFPGTGGSAVLHGGLDFSRTIQLLVRHVVLEKESTCLELVSDNRIASNNVDVNDLIGRKVVGYFEPAVRVVDAIKLLGERMPHNRVIFGQPAGLAFALPLSDETLRRRLRIAVWRAQADITTVWATPRTRLVNVHEEIVDKHGLGDGARKSLVYGYYEYCHYMQDKFNDDGWGCAYRSLQTLCSWFQLQGLVEDVCRPLPSHKQSQEALEKLGEPVGPKQWIGAVEISMILNLWFGVDCKIMNVASGSDIASKTEEVCLLIIIIIFFFFKKKKKSFSSHILLG